MIFNSLTFLLFFTSFFFLYWFVFNKNVKLQNIFLLFGSYLFYGWTDYRFLLLLIVVSAINFMLGIYIEKATKHGQLLLFSGLFLGIGSLAFFKYFNFFITSFNDLFNSLNVNTNLQTLNIIIPLGISFFTFRTISYLLDVEKGKIKAVQDWVVFFNYVSFFPSILSGPIDKARSFVPQLESKRVFDNDRSTDGLRQILWGLFKKLVIADSCALITTQIFNDYASLPASTLLLGAFIYTVQIYADFSGYSDMAIGFARLIGFNVTKNFEFPFFSQNIAEFWRKWHISLTSWLTEYVYTPLSITFRDYDKRGMILAIVINFTICGIWHGANWTYILFGFLHGCYFIPLILKGTMNKKKKLAPGKLFPSIIELKNIILTFTLVMFTFVLFKSENLTHAFNYYRALFSTSLFSVPVVPNAKDLVFTTLILCIIMFVVEWMQRDKEHALQIDSNKKHPVLNMLVYYSIIIAIFWLGNNEQEYIYFQF